VQALRAALDNGYREVFVRSASFWATSERGYKPAWLSLFVCEGSTPSKPAGGDSSPIHTPIS
jgi:hypothetical protein